jgi:chitin disaccharide deacetylase
MRRQILCTAAMLALSAAAVLPAGAQDAPAWSRTPDGVPDRVRLLVRGDDFGYTRASNAAMVRALDAGIMRSVSVMPVGPWIEETAALLQGRDGISIGIHLTVNSEWDRLRWRPLTPAGRVPSLVAPDGAFFKNYRADAADVRAHLARLQPDQRAALERILTRDPPRPGEVELELRAQIARARALGLTVDYLDCHMGTVCSGELRPVLIRLSEELCLPVPELGWMAHEEIGIDWHVSPEQATADLRQLLLGLAPGLYRLVVHTAEDTPELRGVDSVVGEAEARSRNTQLLIMESPAIRRTIEEAGIELVTVRDLWDDRSCRLRLQP